MEKKKSVARGIGLLITVFALTWFIELIRENWVGMQEHLKSAVLPWLVLAVATYGLLSVCLAWNWSRIIWKMEPSVPRKDYMNIYVTAALARYIPGGIWDIAGKVYLCIGKGVAKKVATTAIILEYVFQILSGGIFLVIALFLKAEWAIRSMQMVVLLLILILLVVFLPSLVELGVRLLCRFFAKESGEIRFPASFLYRTLLRYVAVWCLAGFSMIFIVKAFATVNLEQGLYLLCSYPAAWLVGFLSPSPNGLGVREGVLMYLLGSVYASELLLLLLLFIRIWTMAGELLSFMIVKLYFVIHRQNPDAGTR